MSPRKRHSLPKVLDTPPPPKPKGGKLQMTLIFVPKEKRHAPHLCPTCLGPVSKRGECWFCSRGWDGLRATSTRAFLSLKPLSEDGYYFWERLGWRRKAAEDP